MTDNIDFIKISNEYISKDLLTIRESENLYLMIKIIIESEQWNKIKNYPHHNEHNRGQHILRVCFKSYTIALKRKKCDVEKTVIGAMLHDFFDYDWKLPKERNVKFFEMHAFKHPDESLKEALKFFPELVDDKVKDIILKHMFPLSYPPKYIESWIVKYADLSQSLEVFKNPKELPKYIGLLKK